MSSRSRTSTRSDTARRSSSGRRSTATAEEDVEMTDDADGEPEPEDRRADPEPEASVPATVDGPGARDDATRMLSYDAIPVELAEALRGIVNRYELRTGNELPRTIAVTSALPGEGVTIVSQSLATLIAQEIGRFVCWVDCSWLTAREVSPDDDRPSLIDLLRDPTRIHTAFQTSAQLSQLVSLSPGPVPASSRNMIVRSPEFERLLNVLTDEFDHVIFDLPPVISNANSLALLREADATLLAVRHRATSLAQVDRAVQAMEPALNLGVVLTQFKSSIPMRLRRFLRE